MTIRTLNWALTALLLVTAGASRAEELDLALRASAGYSDNVERTSTDEQSSELFAPGFDVRYRETTQRADVTVDGSLDYLNYTAQGLDSQLVGNFYGDLAYGIVPERFVWTVDESFGQGRADVFEPATPQNVEGINYFSTGPTLTLPLSSRMFVTANAEYANSWYQYQDTDSNQYGGGLSLGRSLSQAAKVQATVAYLKVNYTDPKAAADTDLWQYYLAYSAQGARSSVELNAGYRSFDDGSGSGGGPLIQLNLTRQLSAYTTIFVLAGDEYSDAASQLNGTLATPGGSGGGNNGYANGDIFVDTYGGAGLNFSRMRTRMSAMVTYHDQNYVQSSESDVHRWNANGSIERDLSRAWTAGFQFWYYHEDYTNADYSDAELDYGLYASWQFARTLTMTFEWQRWQSTASDQLNANENQYWLRLNWQAVHRVDQTRTRGPSMLPAVAPPPGQ